MKKYLIFAFALLVCISLFACGDAKDNQTQAQQTTTAQTTTEAVVTTTEAVVTTTAPITTTIATEYAPAVYSPLHEIPTAETPNERFASHPAIMLWDDVSSIPSYVEGDSIPTIVPYLSEENNGMIVLLQGTTTEGSYYTSQGEAMALYLNTLGYDVFICKYRTNDLYSALEDIRRAVSFVIYNGSDFGVKSAKAATLGFGNGALLAYIEACDFESFTAVDDIDTIPAKPSALLMFNADFSGGEGAFSGAAPQKAISMSQRVGLYYDIQIPNLYDTLDFISKLKTELRVLVAEVHCLEVEGDYIEGTESAESYASFFSLIKTYLTSIKFN